jgi:hypothetical protein
LLAGQSLLVIALLALMCGLSFYVYAYLRKWIVGREVIVQIERVRTVKLSNRAHDPFVQRIPTNQKDTDVLRQILKITLGWV